MDGRGFKGLPGQLKQASKQGREGSTGKYGELWQRGSGNSHQDCGGERSEQEASQVVYFRESKVGCGAHDEEVSWEQAVGIIQEADNKRQESGRCHEKEERLRITPKLSQKEFGNQLGIWD